MERLQLRHGYRDYLANGVGKLVGLQYIIGVADAPELFRIAEISRGDVVQTLFLSHRVFDQGRGAICWRNEASLYKPNLDRETVAVLRRKCCDFYIVVAAG